MTTARDRAIFGVADLRRMPDDELWNLHQACIEAISAIVSDLEKRGAFPPMARLKAKAGQCGHPRRR